MADIYGDGSSDYYVDDTSYYTPDYGLTPGGGNYNMILDSGNPFSDFFKDFKTASGDVTASSIFSGISDLLKGTGSAGKGGQVGGLLGLAYLLNQIGGKPQTFSGYKGGIPTYTATREQTPYSTSVMTDAAGVPKTDEKGAQIPRRPGSSALTYFKPITYTKAADGGLMSGYPSEPVLRMAEGGIASLGSYSDGGRLLRGPGDGVSDSIPAVIGDKQPAYLADGEFVLPARIVSELGNGSTEAGAKKLYAMMDRSPWQVYWERQGCGQLQS
jgi:hypothetical protein